MSHESDPNSAHIYRLELQLWEHTFFSSREIGPFFQTEPVIGNYALAYALGLAQSPYRVPIDDVTGKQPVWYKRDLGPLNARGIYVTPATIIGEPKFALTQFNAQPDTHWYAFTNNAIVVRPDDKLARKKPNGWFIVDPVAGTEKMVRANNFPQHGRIKMLALGNRAVAYLISREPLDGLPRYVRLGKFMSKAALKIEYRFSEPEQRTDQTVDVYLNSADLTNPSALRVFDLLSIHPAPLIRHARMSGLFHRASDGVWLPAHMRFGVEELP